MKQLVLNIPDKEYNFFVKMLKNFSFIDFNPMNVKDIDIAENQKDIVRRRVKDYELNPQNALEWNDIEKNIKLD